MADYLLLLVGLTGLWAGTKLTINKAVRIAEHFGVSQLFIGLTIISIGTDLPEIVVTVNASLHSIKGEDASGLILGNVIGSCFAQASLVLGIATVFNKSDVNKKQIIRDCVALCSAAIILFAVSYQGRILWYEGIICLIAYGYYFHRVLKTERKTKRYSEKQEGNKLIDIFLLILGIGVVIISSEETISSALAISGRWNISQQIVGIFIIGIGTSLPELAVALQGVAGKAMDISVGTILGSTIFDLLVPTGIGSLIAPLWMERSLYFFDIPAFFILSVMIAVFLLAKKGIQKREGVVLIMFYVVYTVIRLI